MIYAVNRRAWKLLRLKGDPVPYPRHEYAYETDPSPSKQPPPHDLPPKRASKTAASPISRRRLYKDALKEVSLDSGSDYACKQSDLDATGGLARQQFPEDKRKDQFAARKIWFPTVNHGPFTTARKAAFDIFEHNKLSRKPGTLEQEAIERLTRAIVAGRAGFWSPDLIIKAFCDLDVVFFRGRLRGHICVRWLPDWSAPGQTMWGGCFYSGRGKCAIRLNRDTILRDDSHPFERMFRTMLHEMWYV